MSKSLKINSIILKILKFENQLNFAKIIAKNKLPFWEPAKIQKSVGKKSGQLLSRDRSTQKEFSQTPTDHQN